MFIRRVVNLRIDIFEIKSSVGKKKKNKNKKIISIKQKHNIFYFELRNKPLFKINILK
jgi:hypothetical protein